MIKIGDNMNHFIIQRYINQLTKEDIINYTNKQNISLTNKEIDIIYYYIKNKSNEFLKGNHEEILQELKQKLTNSTYKKIEEIYIMYKNKI